MCLATATPTYLLGVHSKVLNLAQRDGLVLVGSLIWGLVALRVRPERTNLNLTRRKRI
jgi:hypothetical protein